MTPFAQQILRASLVKGHPAFLCADQPCCSVGDLPELLARAHCFDITAVRGLIEVLRQKAVDGGQIDMDLGFYPAPVVWTEERYEYDGKPQTTGILYVEGSGVVFIVSATNHLHYRFLVTNSKEIDKEKGAIKQSNEDLKLQAAVRFGIINTPKVFMREVSGAPKVLGQKLAKAWGLPGRVPLFQSTTILLDVAPPPESGRAASGERLTGAKALHFCRQHLRLRNGRFERVRAHWRGDASIGVRVGDYQLRDRSAGG